MPTSVPAFSSRFRDYVCCGDTIESAIGDTSLRIVAEIVFDDDAQQTRPDQHCDGFLPSLDPNDPGFIGEGKTHADLQTARAVAVNVMRAWEAGEWWYVGVCLSVWIGDICLDRHAASLWGIECNYPSSPHNPTPNDYLTEVANDLLPEALSEASKAIETYSTALAEASEALANVNPS